MLIFSEPVLAFQASLRDEEWQKLLVDAAINRLAVACASSPKLGDLGVHLSGSRLVSDAVYSLNAMGYPSHAVVTRVADQRFTETVYYKLLAGAVTAQLRSISSKLLKG